MMAVTDFESELSRTVHEFVRRGFTPHFDRLKDQFPSNPSWAKLRELGSELWLDSGNLDEVSELWTREFAGLTTNNTLLNKEVQTGTYDDLIAEAARLLDQYPDLTPPQRKLEIAFILNARHGLRLVERFDACVSVEEHTDLSHDIEGTVNYARRYHAICPERFYVKIPLSPAGLLATRKVAAEGVPVNHTLGFSARQNYVIARIGRPRFVNVFLGRLNSFVADNDLGDGSYIGERAALASQTFIRMVRRTAQIPTRQIGASFREGKQVRDLAGIDVATMPPKVAKQFLELKLRPEQIVDKTHEIYYPPLYEDVDSKTVRLDTLWAVDQKLISAVDGLEKENLDAFTADDLIKFLDHHRCGDLLVHWSDDQVKVSADEGKIPNFENWADLLAAKRIGLDTLMNLAGWNSFNKDQIEMDQRVQTVLAKVAT